jgi:Family of unknown function (DUF6082)
MKMALDNPGMASAALGISDSDLYVKQVFLNWHFKYLELAYEIDTLSAETVRQVAASLFEAEAPRDWWSWSRHDYEDATISRRSKQFFAIVDAEFQRTRQEPDD